MRRLSARHFPVILFVLGVNALCTQTFDTQVFAGELKERFEKTCPLSRNGRFSLQNENGRVTIMAWDRNEVKIEAEKIARAGRESDAQKMLDATEIIVRQGDNSVEVDTRTPRTGSGDSFWSWMFGGEGGHVSVNYIITVPREIHLKVKSVNGKIDAHEISGHAELATTNGGVEVEEAAGSVSAETTNGRIQVSLAKVADNESMYFETTNGSVVAAFPQDFSATISARTTNGSINCDFPVTVAGRMGRNELEGKIGDNGGRVTLRTTNGSISIRQL